MGDTFEGSNMPKKRSESGDFVEVTSPEDVLAVFNEVEGPIVTTGDVAEALDCSRETARRKLEQLSEQGRVGRRKTAGRVVYWRLDAADPNPVNIHDPFFTDFPTFSSGMENLSERVDELVYGNEH